MSQVTQPGLAIVSQSLLDSFRFWYLGQSYFYELSVFICRWSSNLVKKKMVLESKR